MIAENQPELWQVEVNGQIYEAILADLPDWIVEGSLLPSDKIRKGSLRWTEARNVPLLVPFFNAKANGEPLPAVLNNVSVDLKSLATHTPDVTGSNNSSSAAVTQSFHNSALQSEAIRDRTFIAEKKQPGPSICCVHDDRPSFYLCGACNAFFCKACPKSFGGNVKLCPNCGVLCESIGQVQASKSQTSGTVRDETNEKFGASDFVKALAHPFKFRASLIFGSLMFMLFTLGQSTWAIGGIPMAGAALFCLLLANMLTFGVLANTVEIFSQGRLDADFMPDFIDFSLWNDVIHPFVLCIGVYISSFGAFTLVMILGLYLVMNAVNAQKTIFTEQIAKIPGTELYQPNRTMEQSNQVKDLLDKVKLQNQKRLEQQTLAADGKSDADLNRELVKMAQETEVSKSSTTAGQSSTDQASQYEKILSGILGLAAPLVILGAITFLWGLFYFPAACAVAGYSRSFRTTLNPLVGLDTIRRLGSSYLKILVMGGCLLVVSMILGNLLDMILAPLNLPLLGNLPAKAIASLFGFYFSVVFSCVLGYALFKGRDRLKLYR